MALALSRVKMLQAVVETRMLALVTLLLAKKTTMNLKQRQRERERRTSLRGRFWGVKNFARIMVVKDGHLRGGTDTGTAFFCSRPFQVQRTEHFGRAVQLLLT